MAIQAWTGSGVVGPIDVMNPQRQGQLLVGGGVGLAGWDAPLLGWLLVGLESLVSDM